jgi:hypothetical protein
MKRQMSSALPALLLFSKMVFVRSKMGFPSLSYWYSVLRAEPMTCLVGLHIPAVSICGQISIRRQ